MDDSYPKLVHPNSKREHVSLIEKKYNTSEKELTNENDHDLHTSYLSSHELMDNIDYSSMSIC